MPPEQAITVAWSRAWAWLSGTRPQTPDASPLPFVAEYDAIYRSLEPRELTDDPALLEPISAADLFVDSRVDKFLGYYSRDGLARAFERYGLLALLRRRGFAPVLVVDTHDPDEHRLRVFDGVERRSHLLVELCAGLRPTTLPHGADVRLLFVNWLMMQDPWASFDEDRPPLPSQEHPGLGLFLRFAYLLRLMVERMGLDGLSNHPQHPYNATLYGKVCRFVNPELEGRFRALERDVGTDDLARFNALVEGGRVVDGSGPGGERVAWTPSLQILPVSPRATAWFRSREYRHRRRAARDQSRFVVVPA